MGRAGKIWYVALNERLKPEADFDDFARATTDIAGELYGNGGEVQRIVAGAWSENTVYTGPFFAYDQRDYHFFAQLEEAQQHVHAIERGRRAPGSPAEAGTGGAEARSCSLPLRSRTGRIACPPLVRRY